MSKYLILGNEPDEDRWTLPDDANVEEVRKEIAAAMDEGRTGRIRVAMGPKKQSAELLINGRALQAALVWETTASEPTISIID